MLYFVPLIVIHIFMRSPRWSVLVPLAVGGCEKCTRNIPASPCDAAGTLRDLAGSLPDLYSAFHHQEEYQGPKMSLGLRDSHSLTNGHDGHENFDRSYVKFVHTHRAPIPIQKNAPTAWSNALGPNSRRVCVRDSR